MSTPRSSRTARYMPDSYHQAPTAPAPAIDGNSRPVPNFSASRPFTSHAAARSGNRGGSSAVVNNNAPRMLDAHGSEGRVGPGDVLARRNDVLPGYGFVFDDHVDWSRAVPPPTGASLRPPPPPPDAGRVANAHNPSWIFTYPLPEGHPALEMGGPAGARNTGHRARQPPQPTVRRAFERELNEHLRLDPPPRPSSSAFHRAAAGGGGGVPASQLSRTPVVAASFTRAPPRTLPNAESAAAVGPHRATPGRSPASTMSSTGPPTVAATRGAADDRPSTTSEYLPYAASTLSARNDVDAAIEVAVQRALLADFRVHTHANQSRGAAPVPAHSSASSSAVTPVRPVLSRQAGTGSGNPSPGERRPAPVSAFATTSAATVSSGEGGEAATASNFAAPSTIPELEGAPTPSISTAVTSHAVEPLTPMRAAGVSTSFTPSRGALLLRRRTPAEVGGVADALSGEGYYHQHQRSLTPRGAGSSAQRHIDPTDRVGGSSSPATAANATSGGGGAWQISDFSYDALLRINGGTVPTGLSKRQLERYVARPYGGAGPGGDATCTVCLEAVEVGALSLTLGCQHAFHGPCILQWLARTNQCPTCRFEIPHLNGM